MVTILPDGMVDLRRATLDEIRGQFQRATREDMQRVNEVNNYAHGLRLAGVPRKEIDRLRWGKMRELFPEVLADNPA